MRYDVTDAGHYWECFGHEERCIKGSFGSSKPLDSPSIKRQAFQSRGFGTARRDHRPRAINTGDPDSCGRENLTMRRVAAGNIKHPPDRPRQMPTPDFLEKVNLPLDVTRRLQMDAAENIGKLIDARLHNSRA